MTTRGDRKQSSWSEDHLCALVIEALCQVGDLEKALNLERRARELFEHHQKVSDSARLAHRPRSPSTQDLTGGVPVTVDPSSGADASVRMEADIAIALSLDKAGRQDEARIVLERIDTDSRSVETNEQKKRRLRLAVAFARCGLLDRALEMMNELRTFYHWWGMDGANRPSEAAELANAMAEARFFVMAMETLTVMQADEYFEQLTRLAPYFKDIAPDLTSQIFQETTRIFGWIDTVHRRVYEILRGSEEDATN